MLNLSRPARSITVRGAAASLLAAAYAFPPPPATARDIEGLPPQCAKAGDELAKLKCGRAVFQKQIADAKARSADAQGRSAEAKARSADAQGRSVAAKARSADAKARGAAADVRGASADASTRCMERVAQEAGDPKLLSPEQKAAVRAKILACG